MAPRISQVLGLSAALAALMPACRPAAERAPVAPAAYATTPAAAQFWNSATVYFLLTDRFQDGDTGNDHAYGRASDAATLRGFEGGDLAGVRQQIEAGYFDSLGVSAIWLTPFVEQIHGAVDEGTGRTYGFHGYWTRDWTAVDSALGTREELRALVQAAHRHGIRVLMDAVINHPGPVTPVDPAWPADWVRTTPQCKYDSYPSTVDCTLVPTLPDIRTDATAPVELPPMLVEKWRREGRLDGEVASLDRFFARTGYPRTPPYYIVKWLTDWVREMGFDGYRVDTAKHFEEALSLVLRQQADIAYADWKGAHPSEVLDSLPFYMVGEVYGWWPGAAHAFDFGDRKVDYFAHGYDALINFAFKADAHWPMDSLFRTYDASLHGGPLQGVALLNYVSSHDDGGPYDRDRTDPFGAGTRLLLAPGGAQVYYGDETARLLQVPGAEGDANLRSLMNWGELAAGGKTAAVLAHWRKLGRFRHAHPAIGAGIHRELQVAPYVFSRMLADDRVVIAVGAPKGRKVIPVGDTFAEGTSLVDAYSGATGTVQAGQVSLDTPAEIVLLAPR